MEYISFNQLLWNAKADFFVMLSRTWNYAPYEDLKALEIGGKPCIVKYGTLRNKISVLKRKGIVERYYNSKLSFFVMRGIKFGKHKVHDLEIKKLSKTINLLPENNRGLHNIHTKFMIPDIWKIVSFSGKYLESIVVRSKVSSERNDKNIPKSLSKTYKRDLSTIHNRRWKKVWMTIKWRMHRSDGSESRIN